MIQAHAPALTRDVMNDLRTNERTSTFRRLDPADVEARVSALFYNLAKGIGNADEDECAGRTAPDGDIGDGDGRTANGTATDAGASPAQSSYREKP